MICMLFFYIKKHNNDNSPLDNDNKHSFIFLGIVTVSKLTKKKRQTKKKTSKQLGHTVK